ASVDKGRAAAGACVISGPVIICRSKNNVRKTGRKSRCRAVCRLSMARLPPRTSRRGRYAAADGRHAGEPMTMGARKGAGVVLSVLFVLGLAAGAAHAGDAIQYNVTDFPFEDGTVLTEMRIAYETHGTLSPARDNVIVLLHGARGDRHSYDELIGPGKL